VLPSLETLRALVRACDLELTFHLSNADRDQHDLSLIEASLAKTPADRFAGAVRSANAVERLWQRSAAAADRD
jgi:hypothetical protein